MNNAVVKDNAKVRDWAVVSGSAVVASRARVLEHAQIQGGIVTNDAVAKGCAILWSGGYAGNWGVLEGDFMAARAVTNGVAYGHLPYTGVPDSWVRATPNRQFADYEFNTLNDSMIRDQIGVTDGYTIGSPGWRAAMAPALESSPSTVSNQYVVLDKSLSDLPEISVTAWIKWNGGTNSQPAWHFGAATNKGMFFTPDDGSNRAKFIIRNGGADQTLIAPAALVMGVLGARGGYAFECLHGPALYQWSDATAKPHFYYPGPAQSRQLEQRQLAPIIWREAQTFPRRSSMGLLTA
jgi:hypothetical protein